MKSRERRHTMNQVKRRKRVELYLRLKRGIV